ncbi:hypothetical protein WMY93_003010 [Mugilogobius chulae]|uniref:Ig-like domain-containing protein n=1 Tax=Mugilogobius chulae TaxID=88201 RepID=A0AAW0PY56_9GOBI
MCLLSTRSTVGGVEMYTPPKVFAVCGQNVTLSCLVISETVLDEAEFTWKESKDLCGSSNSSDIKCEKGVKVVDSTHQYNLSLVFTNVQPHHKGTYHCKLNSKQGTKNSETILRIQSCVGKTSVSVTSEVGTCKFEDVYPKPQTVLWWHGGTRRETLKTEMIENPDAKYTVISSVKLWRPPYPFHTTAQS